MLRAAFLAALVLLAGSPLVPKAAADFPWDEAGDVVWCADVASQTARQVIQDNVDHYGQTVTANYYSVKCKLRTHAPIVLNGDPPAGTSPVDMITKYGIIEGTGSAADPYIIQGWSITRSQSVSVYTPTGVQRIDAPTTPTPVTPLADWGIQLLHVTKHYVIDGVHIEGFRCDADCYTTQPNRGAIKVVAVPYSYDSPGIHLTIRGSALLENDYGILMEEGGGSCPSCPSKGHLSIEGNVIRAQGYGILTSTRMHDLRIVDNHVEPVTVPRPYFGVGYHALWIRGARNGLVEGNDLRGTFIGIHLWWAKDVYGWGNVVCATHPFDDFHPEGYNSVSYTRVYGCGV